MFARLIVFLLLFALTACAPKVAPDPIPHIVIDPGAIHEQSGDRVWWFDFSSVTEQGSYLIRDIERGVESHPFDIADDVYTPVLKAAFKTFYYQRAGFEKRAPYALPGYADGASHLGPEQDTEARLFSAKDDTSIARDLRGGWYDAGDYNKYTNWTANYVRGLLHAYLENFCDGRRCVFTRSRI